MHNRRIYVDLDDVLCETARAFIMLLQSHFSKTVAFDDIFAFDLGVSFNLNATEYELFMHLAHEPGFLSAIGPIDGAADALNALVEMGYEIAVITGRPPRTAAVSEAWLKDNRIPCHSLTFVDKYGRGTANDGCVQAITLDELKQTRFFFAVEDSGDMAAFLAGQMAQPVALFDRPWNRAYEFDDPQSRKLIDRCADWAEVLTRFRQRTAQGR